MPPNDAPVPLWRQLQLTARLLKSVRQGHSLNTLLGTVESRLRPGVQALIFHVLRRLGHAQALRAQLAPRAPAPAADSLLCCALALASHARESPYTPFTLVDQAVEAAKREAVTRASAGFINACLRRFLRERDALNQAISNDPLAQWNHPRWWIDLLARDYPDRYQDILEASHAQPPLSLRVNRRRMSRDDYLRELARAGMAARPVGRHGVTLSVPRPVHEIPGFEQGWVSVQDAAAQMAAPLLLDGLQHAGRARVLDACAAPGGKTAHLLEYADVEVTVLDIDTGRCARIHDNLRRLGLNARVITADAGEPQTWWPGECGAEPFDAILLDAPCTASGIVRRHPDVPWLRRKEDVARLAAEQRRLLQALWPLLRPGGRMLYATCSIFHEEGQTQMQTFVAHNTEAVLRPSPGHLVPHFRANPDAVPDNLEGEHDGFFYALLERRAP